MANILGVGRCWLAWGAWILVCVCAGGEAQAQYRRPTPEPLATDRPGNANAATVVTRGHLNIEASALYVHPGADAHALSFPVVGRFGVWDRLELRAGSAVVGVARAPGVSTVDPTDTLVGVKVAALHARDAVPDLAFSADVALPTGGGPFAVGVAVPELRALSAWGLPRGFGLLLNLGASVPDDAGRYALGLYVVNVSFAPPACNGRLSVFVEGFGQHALRSEREDAVQLDWGASGLLSDDMQIDVFLQHGLTDAAPDLQVSLGFSVRL